MSRSDRSCGQHLLIHGAGSTAYVVAISRAEYRKIGLADRQSGDAELPIHGVYEALDLYPAPDGPSPRPAHPSRKECLVCPSCNNPLRRVTSGTGWSVGRCEELRRETVHQD